MTKELFGAVAGVLVLTGIAYAIFRGDETVKIIGTAGDSFANVLRAATPRA